MQYQILMIILAVLIGTGCGRMPARYNQAAFACGEMDPEEYQTAAGLLQIFKESGEALTGDLVSALWITDRKITELSVSHHGCILTPKSEGSLKIVTSDGRQGILLPQTQGNLEQPTPIRLKSLSELRYQVSCRKRAVHSLSDLGLTLTWNNGQESDFWQIEKLTLVSQSHGATSVRRVALPVQQFLQQPDLMLAPISWPDGVYTLKLELSTIAGVVVSSETSCQIELDQTVPEMATLLRSPISDGLLPLALAPSSPDVQVFYCISPADRSECEDLSAYTKAGDFIHAPGSGSFVLNSYSEDNAGNRSPTGHESFYRDQTQPVLSLEWNNPHLQKNQNWSKEPEATYEVNISAQDDSVAAGFMTNAKLVDNLQCSVAVVDGAGATRGSSEAICQSQRCQGERLNDWTPCDSKTRFSFKRNSESALFYTQVIFRVKDRDESGHERIAQSSFWMHPQAWGMWSQDSGTNIPSNSGRHDFLNDGFGNILRFTGQLGKDSDNSFPAFSVKLRDGYGWSKPIMIEDYGTSGPHSASNERLPLLGFSTLKADRSLWYSTFDENINGLGLAEVPLYDWSTSETPAILPAKVRTIPASILQQVDSFTDLYITGLVNVVDPNGHEKIIVLLTSFYDAYAFVAFDGKEFRLLSSVKGIKDTISMKNDLVLAPDNKSLIFVLGNQMARFDLETYAIRRLDDHSPVKKTFRSIKRDRQGYFGYTDQHELFTAQFNTEASEFSISLIAAMPPLLIEASIDVDPFSHIVRTADGVFWLSALSEGMVPQLFRFRPGLDQQWRSQNALWGWTNQLHAFGTFALGLDQEFDRLYFATSDFNSEIGGLSPLVLRSLMTCDFMDVTEQAAFRTDQKSNPTVKVVLNQDSAGNLWRAQVLVNLQIAISKMDEAAPARIFDVDPSVFSTVTDNPDSLLFESNGNLFAPSKAKDGLVPFLRFDRESGATTEAFKLSKDRRRSFFDRTGSLWTLNRHDIQVLHKDGSVRSILIAEPWIGWNMNPLGPDKAWISVFDTSAPTAAPKIWKHLELDLAQENVRDDKAFENPLFEIADMVIDGKRKLAVVRTPYHGADAMENQSVLQIFEDQGQGWVPWTMDLQPHVPSWHYETNHLITSFFRSDTHLFVEPDTHAVWLSAASIHGRPILARFDKKAWHFFDPEKQVIKDVVQKFQADGQGRTYLQTDGKVFVHNRACTQP